MSIGLVGRKCGMSRIFTEEGASIPVTVVEALPNRIVQTKTIEKDGYEAIQVTTGQRRASLVNQPTGGHYKAHNALPGEGLWEFRVSADTLAKLLSANAESVVQAEGEEGASEAQDDVNATPTSSNEITVSIFEHGQRVDVTGTTKGKGFAGAVKRHNFAMQDATHGNSLSHRAPGSIGQCQTPGRVFKGKKMAGQMGNVKSTTQNLEVVGVDKERHLLLIKGAVPGAPNGKVIIRPAVKQRGAKS